MNNGTVTQKIHTESLKDRHLNLLLVEDSFVDALMVKKLLSRHMPYLCQIIHAEDMAHAQIILNSDHIDIILLDLGLPDTEGGTDTFERIEEIRGEIPVVILTSEDNHELAMDLVDNGAEDFIKKSTIINTPELLCNALDFAVCRHDHFVNIKEHSVSELKEKDMVIQWLTGSYSVMK